MADLRRMALYFVAWAMVLSVLAQVFLAGISIESDASYWNLHRETGAIVVTAVSIVLVIVAALSRLPRDSLILAILILIFTLLTPVFIVLKGSIWAGLHPVFALVTFGLSIMMLQRTRTMVPPPWGTATQ